MKIDPEVSYVGPQVPILPNPRFEDDSTSYAFNRGGTRFEVSANELIQGLEEETARMVDRFPGFEHQLDAIRATPDEGMAKLTGTFPGALGLWPPVLTTMMRRALKSGQNAFEENQPPGLIFPGRSEWPAAFIIPVLRQCFWLFEDGRFRILGDVERDSTLVIQRWETRFGGGGAHGGRAIILKRSGIVVLTGGYWTN